ncbi:MAG: sulfite exporter TauE/SafE family protein [Acidobacteriaceae bacterium]|nr:sulfite exporter TauE/SafE family protein [Acidobacteriaceae bacterium]MBV9443472.1 sulfite exporter TauE/SafE family protein [Acidobacteriaceae bacterium]
MLLHYVVLFVAAFLAGIINSIAGGGSFLTFPALVLVGVPAVVANASNTVALVPGSLASGVAYRRDIQRLGHSRLKAWLIVCMIGGAIGALLLLFTSDRTFRQIAPWLLLFATALFAFGAQVSAALRGRLHSNQIAMLSLLFPIAIYGGYFGGGIGIMILAAFRLYGMTDIHGMNGIKTILSALLNAIASVIFIAAHQVAWVPTLFMIVAAIAGGYAGPLLARRVKPQVIRHFVTFVGIVMTGYFFYIAPR